MQNLHISWENYKGELYVLKHAAEKIENLKKSYSVYNFFDSKIEPTKHPVLNETYYFCELF